VKKIVLTFGIISGVIASVLMVATIPFMDRIGFDYGLMIGYSTMVVAFLLVFFGIRSYRENVGGGQISFGRAFSVGILIVLVSSILYVITWEIVYFNFLPDFVDKYSNYLIEKSRASGASAEEIAAQTKQMNDMKVVYNNPLYNAAFTLLEPLPVGLVMTLISAALLRRKGKPHAT